MPNEKKAPAGPPAYDDDQAPKASTIWIEHDDEIPQISAGGKVYKPTGGIFTVPAKFESRLCGARHGFRKLTEKEAEAVFDKATAPAEAPAPTLPAEGDTNDKSDAKAGNKRK